jgi:hypothetical protein
MGFPRTRDSLRTRLYQIRNAAKHEAHIAVVKALYRGVLVKATACEHCDGFGPFHGHHHQGYDRAHQLDVIWLCGSCHWRAHHSVENWREANQPMDPVSAEEYLLLLCPNPVGRPWV